MDDKTHFSWPCREGPPTCCAFPVPIPATLATAVFFQFPFPGVIENAVFFQFPFPGVIENAVFFHFLFFSLYEVLCFSSSLSLSQVPSRKIHKNTGIAIMPKEGSWKSTAVAITSKERKWKKAGTEPAKRVKTTYHGTKKTNYKLGKITLHILCAPADHRPPYRRWTNYSNPCNPITTRTPNYNVVFLVWFAPSNRRNKSNPKIRNKDTKP